MISAGLDAEQRIGAQYSHRPAEHGADMREAAESALLMDLEEGAQVADMQEDMQG